jgi:hypothetical protein
MRGGLIITVFNMYYIDNIFSDHKLEGIVIF